MLEIAIIIPYRYPVPAVKGGAIETLVESLIQENEKSKLFKFTVYTIYDERAYAISKSYSYTNFRFFKRFKIDTILDFLFRGLKKFKIYIPFSVAFFKILKDIKKNEDKYDYVLFESGYTYAIPLINKYVPKEKILNHLHWYGDGNKKIDNSFGYLLPVSDFVAAKWSQVTERKSKEIYVWKNCVCSDTFSKEVDIHERINLKKMLNIPKNNKVILFTGRIITGKGILELLQAYEKVNYKNVTLMIIGSSNFGDCKKTLFERSVEEQISKINKQIIFTGFIHNTELPLYYSIVDFAVMPSICEEAAGLVNIEDQTAGIPVIATRVGGIPEYIDKNSTILIDNDFKLVENLKNYMELLLNDEDRCKKMSVFSKENSKKYTKEIYYARFCEIIGEINNKI